MEYLVGVVAAVVVGFFALLSGFDRERVFYPTVLIVVATYYLLFATMAGSMPALAMESAAAVFFVVLAVAGFRKSLWVAAAGLAGHCVFDFFHALLIRNPGVPDFWPGFCLSYDGAAAIFLGVLLARRPGFAAVSRGPIPAGRPADNAIRGTARPGS